MDSRRARAPRSAWIPRPRCSRHLGPCRGAAAALVLVLLVAVALVPRAGAQGHPGLNRPDVGPGQGPQESYHDADWTYWWYLNHEVLVPIRPRLSRTGVRPLQGQPQTDVLEVLRRTCRDSNPQVRAASLMAIAKSGSVADAALILAAVGDRSLNVRLEAILALGVLGAPGQAAEISRLFESRRAGIEERRHAAISMALLGGAPARTFFEKFLAPKTFVRLEPKLQDSLALAAGISAEASLSDEILGLLDLGRKRINASTRAYLVGAMGQLGDPAGLELLLDQVVNGSSTLVRRSAALGLGELQAGTGDLQAINVLGNALRDEGDVATRNFIEVALGRIGGGDAALMLNRSIQVEEDHLLDEFKTRPLAAVMLGLIRDSRMTEPLFQQFRAEEIHEDRAAFALALGLQGDARAAVNLRRELMRTKDPILRGYLALGLGLLGDTEAGKPLLAVLGSENDIELVPRAALALAYAGKQTEATQRLLARLQRDRGAQTRRIVLYCLGLIGDTTAVSPVLGILKSTAPAAVRRYAAVALGDLADRRDIRPLARIGAGLNYTIEPQLLSTLLIIL